ncbi:MAG TPA: VTT domain-containing protein [Burkholderiales bacterium]|nr:VTT domain-containing protein [Burkholderiales bacterium]
MDALTSLLAQHGLSLVFANVLLAQLGFPLPAVPMLVLAGALLGDGTLSVLPLALAVITASLLGDMPWYLAGRRYGYRVLRTLCRISMEPDSCVKQTENIFSRWGPPSLIVAKYVPGFSTVAPPLAGTMGVGFGRFLAYSAVAALLWAALPVACGFFFRTEVEWLLGRLEAMGAGAAALAAALVVAYFCYKAFQRYLLIRFLRMVRISTEELRTMIGQGQEPVILDVRSSLAREAEPRTIPGAISVQLDSVEDVLARVPPGRDVVVYCS